MLNKAVGSFFSTLLLSRANISPSDRGTAVLQKAHDVFTPLFVECSKSQPPQIILPQQTA
jgi:hypothetical protein